ncbi:hypothetical protein BT96DRAFT_353020 [Gymnopus androsaceus JB14]|uniref:LysM domain-containing protein n=1 Tax=Gymnopus androsaceus JB14 TaxID=1447944 RepID=A0A6A4GWF6_9AGAR|nr:hypothetical protein BT96DRAFT_353020 [Gymnopus androsaceus JB14]
MQAVDANCDNLSVGEKLCIPFPPTGCSAQHTVISGDNCVAIAAEFGTTFAALVAANSNAQTFFIQAVNAECSNLSVGEVLCIPCATQYTIRPGDVCDSIAAQFGVTAAELQAANAAVDPLCDNLAVGEVLCIPSEA